MISISAYVPSCNNAQTIARALQSIRNQTVSVGDLFVIDDYSQDGSPAIAEAMGISVIKQSKNLGRGAMRHLSMLKAEGELVLCLDAGKVLPADFIEKALPWFEDPKVAAVYGRIQQAHVETLAERWAFHHIYRTAVDLQVYDHAALITGGAMVRKSQVLAVGNFNEKLRHGEDADLSKRLSAAGYNIVFDPQLTVQSIVRDRLAGTLERYWRWNASFGTKPTTSSYLNQIAYSIKVMAFNDLKAGDPAAAAISLFSPHYQFWRSVVAHKQ